MQTLEDDGIQTLVHYDAKTTVPGYYAKNIPALYSKFKVNWAGYSIVRATELLMQKALQTDADFFFLLSGQDYPLKPIAHIRSVIDPQTIYMECFQLPSENWAGRGGLDRLEWLHFHDSKGLLFRYRNRLLSIQKNWGWKRSLPKNKKLFGGSQWFSLPKQAAAYLVDEIPRWEAFFRYTTVPDEMVFQTILKNSPFAGRIDNNNLRLIDWSKPGPLPYTWQVNDLEELCESPQLFARKFDCEEQQQLLDLLDEHRLQLANDQKAS